MSQVINQVPLLDLKRQYRALKSELDQAVLRVAESQYFILGPEVEGLEKEVAAYCGAPHGIGVSSGTDALIVALLAAGAGPGTEVITTPYSFFATVSSIVRVGAKPVLVDIDPVDFNIVPEAIAAAITPKTKAIIPVHLFGQCCRIDEICKIAESANVAVIEDAAQAIGAELNGRKAGTFGQYGCFSFFPSKNLGGFGDGGMITVLDKKQDDLCKMLRVHGSRIKYSHELVGGNFRLDALQAAVLRVKLPHLDSWSEQRAKNGAIYSKLLTEAGVVAADGAADPDLSPKKAVLPATLPGRRHIFNQFVIRTKRRDALLHHLRSAGIGCEVYYPTPLHLQECFSDLGYREGAFPESERAALETAALPIFPELEQAEIEYVVSKIVDFLQS
jgi:dTDP-4-amino-4,6-dideoxygalactose transaminase